MRARIIGEPIARAEGRKLDVVAGSKAGNRSKIDVVDAFGGRLENVARALEGQRGRLGRRRANAISALVSRSDEPSPIARLVVPFALPTAWVRVSVPPAAEMIEPVPLILPWSTPVPVSSAPDASETPPLAINVPPSSFIAPPVTLTAELKVICADAPNSSVWAPDSIAMDFRLFVPSSLRVVA